MTSAECFRILGMARRWSATFGRKIIVLLAFLSPVLQAAPDTTAALCPAHVGFTQLSSDIDEGNARGIKRSVDGDISAESPPAFSTSPNHEIQPTDLQRNPPLTAQGQTTGLERRSHPNVSVSKNQELAASKSGKTEKQEGKDGQKHKEHRAENGDTHRENYLKTDEPEMGQQDKEQQKSKNKDQKVDKMKHSTGHHRFGKKKQAEKERNTEKYGLLEGHHKKGHRTKGEHKIHKKNEYHKKHEFYHEHHDNDGHAKNRGFNKTRKKSSGRIHNKEGRQNAMHKKAHKSIRGGHSKANKQTHYRTGHVVERGLRATHGHKKEDAKNGSIKEGEKYT